MKRLLTALAIILCMTFICPIVVPAYAGDYGHESQGLDTMLDGLTVEKDANGNTVMNTEQWDNPDERDKMTFSKLFEKYRTLAAFITGILTITSLFALFFFISKYGHALDNEFSRRRAIAGIATSAVGVALMGSATMVLAFFYQFLNT